MQNQQLNQFKSSMKPIKTKILVKPISTEKTASGIYLPGSNQKENKGKVVAIGDTVKTIKVGDTVLYYEHSGIPYTIGTEEHLFLNEGTEKAKGDIIAVL